MQRPSSPPRCAACGYDLSGTPVTGGQITCPECGGHRVRMTLWWEPRSSWRWAGGYLLLTPLGVAPTVGLLGLLLPVSDWLAFLAACLPPFVLQGLVLAAWRPAPWVGVVTAITTCGVGLVLAGFTFTWSFMCMPIGAFSIVLYYILPVPVAIYLTRHAFRAEGEAG